MPSYQFGDEENFSMLLPDGDYVFEVIGFESGISTGKNTSGSETVDLKLAFYKESAAEAKKVGQRTETLIFHKSCAWRIDTFVKASNFLVDGRIPRKGEILEYNAETMMGLRGWCKVGHQKSTTDADKVYNRVDAWLTDKPKLVRRAQQEPTEEEAF